MKRSANYISIFSIAVLTLAYGGLSRPAAAADVNFAGQTINMTIGFSAGGGVDLYGRTLGRHLVQHLPGNPSIIVHNRPGAGGVVALNEWSRRADKDGLSVTIGAQSQTDPDALRRTKAKFDPATFKMIGGLGAYSQGVFIRKDAVQRLTNKSAEPVIAGMVGTTLRGGTYQILWGALFLGWNVKWVSGYHGTGEIRQALERGEIETSTFGAIKDFDYLANTKEVTVISQTGQIENGKRVARPMLDAPIFSDMVEGKIRSPQARQAFKYWEHVSQIGMWLALPPGTPDAVVDTYVKAFEATNKDPAFKKEYSKIAPDYIVASKSDLEEQLRELAKVTPATMKFLEDELKRQGLGKK